jgi:putative ABC transport system ATP-binding protein
MKNHPIIQIINLTKVYGLGDAQVKALDNIDIEISEGEFVAIMGPSGSGKSTLMNILGCLDRPTLGQYLLAGEDVSSLNKQQLAAIRNRHLGFIFQSYNLLPRTTALENVMLPMLYDRGNTMSEGEQRSRAMKALESVDLGHRANHFPQQLSGGQTQRVAIARALVTHPLLILADEPTGNLDTHASIEIMAILSDLHAEGRTIVMITHEPDIATFAGRIVHFRDGHIETDQQNGHHPVLLHPEEVVYESK